KRAWWQARKESLTAAVTNSERVILVQQGDNMKKSYLTAVVMLMCLLGAGVVGARAQTTDAVVVNVPFEFVAGGATLPAGEYRVSRLDPGVGQELFISGSTQGGAFLLPLAFE